jgi:acetyl-CoA carboxylase carboxyltransferase component
MPTISANIVAALAIIAWIYNVRRLKKTDKLEQEVIDLNKRVRELTEDKKDPLKCAGNYYVNELNEPFCRRCYVIDHIRIHLVEYSRDASCQNLERFECKIKTTRKLSPEEIKEMNKTFGF